MSEELELTDNSNQPSPAASIGWRIGLAVVALVIVGALLFPFLPTGSNSEPAASPPVTPTAAAAAGPAATAQAQPDSPQAQFELGNAYYQAGQLAEAVTAYERAIALDPNYQAAYANLGVVYYQQQQFELAASQYEKALELNPDDGDVAYNLGVLYLQQALSGSEGDPDSALIEQAISQLQAALNINPNLAEPHFSLGVAYLALNQPAEAQTAFQTFLSMDTVQNSRARQEAERYLEMLQAQ